MLDRGDETVRARQDLVLNVLLFGGAVLAIKLYGHKLAV
jgi:hypothetical protein